MTERGSACRAEAEHLLGLADTLTDALADPQLADDGAWKSWRDEVEALIADPEGVSLAGESQFDELTGQLRELWLRCAHRCSDRHYRSPPLAAGAPLLPSGEPISYSYERNIQATVLERRIAKATPVPVGWRAAHVAYANGMAAMTNLLQTYQSMVAPTAVDPLGLGMWGAYFETEVLLELLRGETFQPHRITTQLELCEATRDGAIDVLVVEPVRYDWEMEPLDLTALLSAWRQRRARRPSVLVIDTSLVSTTWPTERLLSALSAHPPEIVVEVRSGLKLDQQGLELANLGIVSVFTAASAEPGAEEIAVLLRKMRTIVGSGLSLDALAALDAPFVLDRTWTMQHASAVFLNNALVATVLARFNGLFSRIAHPALAEGSRPWAQGPFVVCHLREDTVHNHGLLLGVVEFEARRRGLCLSRGSSFGFRGHRFETIIPKLSEQRGLFKIAMGARCGPSLYGTIELFSELARFPGFAALAAAYPDVTPVDLTDLEQ